ncbi:zinc finger protein [Schistosoma japonicum]|nr:zinc finger protein [Schistosoma japonicum]
MDLVGADDIENHLRTHNHQKKYKEKFNLEQFAFEEEMKLSVSDSVFAVWKTCQSRASKELARIIGEKGFHLCVCGFRITCYDDMRKHFPIKYYEIHPRIRSWKKSLEKCIRSRADRHRIDYRDCYTILTLFGLPSHIIDMKREQALETAKAKLLEDSTKGESTADDTHGEHDEEDEEENDDEEEEDEGQKLTREDEMIKNSPSNAEPVVDEHPEPSST